MSSLEPKKPEHEQHRFTEDFLELMHHHKWDAGAYILLFCGLLLCLFRPFIRCNYCRDNSWYLFFEGVTKSCY